MTTATLTWTPPTTRTDGAALPPNEIAGSDIYDLASADPATPIGTVSGASGSFTTGDLSVGIHNFSVTVRDTTGHASATSNIASVEVVVATPSAITDLRAMLNAGGAALTVAA